MVSLVAVDDGYFPPVKRGKTTLAAVLWERDMARRVALDLVTVDGTDATEASVRLLERLGSCASGTLVLFDGVAYAGFNFVEPLSVKSACGCEFLVYFAGPLDLEKIGDALVRHFPDWELRLEVFERAILGTRRVYSRRGPALVYTSLSPSDAAAVLSETQLYSPVPEPLRVAHMIASEASRLLRRLSVL